MTLASSEAFAAASSAILRYDLGVGVERQGKSWFRWAEGAVFEHVDGSGQESHLRYATVL